MFVNSSGVAGRSEGETHVCVIGYYYLGAKNQKINDDKKIDHLFWQKIAIKWNCT